MKTPNIRRGFTLLELLVVVLVLGVLTSFAYPAFQKYIFDAKVAEGTQLLLEAHREQERVMAETGKYTEYLYSSKHPYLYVRKGNPKFNLITGETNAENLFNGDNDNNALSSFLELGLYSGPSSANGFGTGVDDDSGNPQPFKYLIGAEADIRGNGYMHVMGVNEKGQLFVLCDAWTENLNDGVYKAYSLDGAHGPLQCQTTDNGGNGGEGDGGTGL